MVEKVLQNRIFDVLQYQLQNYPRKDALCDKKTGAWRKYSTEQVIEIVDKVSLGLLKLGLGPDDKIALISYNRTEWTLVDFGILQIGAQDVPLYPNMSDEDSTYIFNDAEVKLVFVENKDLYDKVRRILPGTPSVKDVYTFEKIEGAKHWSDITNAADESLRPRLNELKAKVTEDDLATIIYTSGTTGVPKGVMLTHKNILSDVTQVRQVEPHNNTHRMISFLPICHIFERTAVYFYFYVGGAIYFAESIDKIGENIREVQPNYFTTVPRVMEKIFDKIMGVGRDLTGIKKAIFGWAVKLANKYHPQGKNSAWYNFRLGIARKLVFHKWVEALGGNVLGIISGAAALQPRIGRIFEAAEIPIRPGYGLTETSPVLTCNRFTDGDWFIGTVGIPLPEVKIKIDEESGEILAKGPNVMIGYYKKPEATAEVIDADGWFHTGDVGEIIDGRFLKITDRIKEIFKTSGGKYVAPLPIENKMKESLFIDQIMVIGNKRKFPAAIIVPDFEFINKWCKKKCVALNSKDEMIKSQILNERIWQDVEKYNKRFGKVQQVKKIVLVADNWSPDTGEITPTLKLKRRVILKKYEDLIDKLYEDESQSHYYIDE